MMSAPSPYPVITDTTSPLPDDAQINTVLPSICVDYLSHNWDKDEQIWASWKAMTKSKNEITNGVRLENASWRTWAKQRGNLKTISPETLNWLKDSDVTYLYGPLHETPRAVPPPKEATFADRLGLDQPDESRKPHPGTPRSNAASPSLESQMTMAPNPKAAQPNSTSSSRSPPGPKSILKHRTIIDVFGPRSTRRDLSPFESGSQSGPTQGSSSSRAKIISVRSDTNLVARGADGRIRLAGSPSPSKEDADQALEAAKQTALMNQSMPMRAEDSASSAQSSSSAGSAQDAPSATGSDMHSRQSTARISRHISFNHVVEQCIALRLDDAADRAAPNTFRPAVAPHAPAAYSYFLDSDDDDIDDRHHEDFDVGFDEDYAMRSNLDEEDPYRHSYTMGATAAMAGNMRPRHGFFYSDSEEEDEDSDSDALTMGSSSATSPRNSLSDTASRGRPHTPSSKPQLLTIAKLAPTLLRGGEHYPAPSPVVVDPTGYLLKLGAKGQLDNDPQELDEEKVDYSSETATIVDEGERGRTAPLPSVQSTSQEVAKNQSDDIETTKAKANASLHPASQRLLASSSSDERSPSPAEVSSRRSSGSAGDSDLTIVGVTPYKVAGSGPGWSSSARRGDDTPVQPGAQSLQKSSASGSTHSAFNHYDHHASDGPSGPVPIRASRHHQQHGPTAPTSSPNLGSAPVGSVPQSGSLTSSYSSTQSYGSSTVSASDGSGSGSGSAHGSTADLSATAVLPAGHSATIPIQGSSSSSSARYGLKSTGSAGSDNRSGSSGPAGYSISSSTSSSSLCSLDFDGAGNPVSPSGRLERGRSRSRSGPGSSSSFDRLSDAAQAAYASSLASGTDFDARSRSRGSSSSSSLQSWGSCQMSDRPRGGARGGEESMSPLGSTSTRASLSTGAVGAAGPRRHGEHGSRADRGTNSGRRPPAARGRSRHTQAEHTPTKGGISVQIGSAGSTSGSSAESSRRNSIQAVPPSPVVGSKDVAVRTSPRSVKESSNDDSTPVLTPRRSLAGSSHKGEVDVNQSNSGDDSTPNLAKSKNRSRAGSTSGSGTDVPGQKDRTASNATLSPHPRIGSAAILSANSSPTPAPGTPVGPEPPTTSTSSETAARAAVESKSGATISPGVGVGGATPGNTPRVRTGKRRSDSAAGGSATAAAAAAAAVKGHRRTGSASSMPAGHRRSSSSSVPHSGGSGTGSSASNKPYGALVVPRDSARAGVMDGVPLAPDHMYEDEGSLVGRAVEFVNTARDLVSALWGGVSGGGRTSFSGGR